MVSAGYVHSWVSGRSPAAGNGLELTYLYYPSGEADIVPWAVGGFSQVMSYDGTLRLAVGPQVTYRRLLGFEAGYAFRDADRTHEGTHGLHLATFATIGLVSFALRIGPAFGGERGHGYEVAPTLGIKFPIPVHGEYPNLLPVRAPSMTFGHRGRPLRDGHEVLLPAVHLADDSPRSGRSWSTALRHEVLALGRRARSALAERWMADARSEHASVAAFERLAHELRELGAPHSLVRAAERAATDERRHADLCTTLASLYAGRRIVLWTDAAPAPRRASLEVVAREALLDGWVGEGVAARVARHAAERAHPGLRRALGSIGRDEARHAALGRRIFEWSAGHRGLRLHETARELLAAPRHVTPPPRIPRGIPARVFERHGQVGAKTERRALARTLVEVRVEAFQSRFRGRAALC